MPTNNYQKTSKWLLYISTFLIPFYFFRFSILKIPTNIFEVVVLAAALFFLFTDGLKSINKKNWASAGILILILAISIFISSDKRMAFGIAKGWFIIPAIYAFLVYKIFDRKDVRKLSIPLFIVLILVSAWALLQKIGLVTTLFYQVNDLSFDQYLNEGRIFGPFESPNYLAMFLSPVFFLSLPLLDLIKKQTARLFIWILLVLPLLAIYFTGSRGGIIASAICIFVYLNYRYINYRTAIKTKPFHQVIFTSFLLIINASYLFYATRIANVTSGGDEIRVEIYKYAIKMLKADWLFGFGLGNFQNKIGQISASNASFQQYALSYALHPHNLLLAIWLNLGLLGFALFIYIIVIIFKNVFSSAEYIRAALIAAMFAILIHGLFDTTYLKNDLSAIFWLIFVISVMIKNEKNISNN